MNPLSRCLIPLLAAVMLCQCGVPQPPQCHSVPSASRVPAASLIEEARQDWAILGNSGRISEWPEARNRYNGAVAKLFDQLRCGTDGWDGRAAALGTRIGRSPGRDTDLVNIEALFPASVVNCKVVHTHRLTEGVGVPLVGWKTTSPVGQKRDKFLLPNGLPYNITTTLAFDEAGEPVWHFDKRWIRDDVRIGASTHTLAADWTGPNAFYWQMCDLDDLKIQNVILPDRYMEETGIFFVTPYDPKKIPVVFVHGLVSSPDAFKNVINELAPEPWFREHYQIWLYNYPTGNPWLYSSMNFRKYLRAACAYGRTKGDGRNLDRMVIVSHSMGGLLTRSSVTSPGTKFYDAVFKVPIDKLKVSEPTRQLIRDTTLYQPLTEPKRVIFMAVPHQGSPVATFRAAVWISRLIHLPKKLTVELLDATIQGVTDAMKGKQAKPNMPNSISSLSPKDKSNIALTSMPLPKNITFHSIIGDRGKGDTPDSSDGIVPYWSSHVEPVASEKIVPCNHSVPDSPEAAEELKRILKLHLGSSPLKTEN